MDEIESIEKQIENTEKNILLIEERISDYIPTDVPLGLIKNERALRARLIGLNKRRDNLQKGRDIPPLLLYLVNRRNQYEKFTEAFKILSNNPDPKPLLCIIHGDQFQCHDTFLESLVKVSLHENIKKYTNITTKVVKKYHLEWPPRMKNIEELKNKLEDNLEKEVFYDISASKEDINERLSSIGPVIIHTYLNTTDWQQHKSGIIENFLEFWQNWPKLNPNQYLIICLFIKYQVKQNMGLWKRYKFWSCNRKIQRSIKDLSLCGFTKFDRIIGVVLPELQGIMQTEVESWARSKKVKKYWGKKNIQYLIHTIQDMFDNWEKEQASDTMPMSYLDQQLTNILNGKVTIKGDIS
ncbi:MAG: hypothetical protein F6K54_20845 [Okeania sp. SIO3B5]|uniref:hypothetical protein n=1 Tax=Okeania sp. SIO3B5 TaxID=2607811 RepID=UPI001401112C|nr:hypothetical protein [Okeania sp. SIO3B5]NEO55301.1 hypothetical protein [Okeania sp. SIO3B5]